MNQERWRQVEEIYHAALERAPSERSVFLDEACAGDTELCGSQIGGAELTSALK
jgi:hypothetical protein